MARFYWFRQFNCGEQLSLPEKLVKHIQVFRLQPNSTIVLFNGLGGEYSATINSIGRKTVEVSIDSFSPISRELDFELEIWPALINTERLDWLIEKAVELGATAIRPIQTEHCAFKLTATKLDKKAQHWQAVAIAAMQQSGRTKFVPVEPLNNLAQAIHLVPINKLEQNNQALYLSLQQPFTIMAKQLVGLSSLNKLIILSGPEGGFTSAEELKLREAKFNAVSLGNRVLRAETAAIAALSLAANLVKI